MINVIFNEYTKIVKLHISPSQIYLVEIIKNDSDKNFLLFMAHSHNSFLYKIVMSYS